MHLKIENNLVIVIGFIIEKNISTKSGEYYKASFEYKGNWYESEARLNSNCTQENFFKKVYRRKVNILIDSTNPSNNIMLTDKNMYKKYNLEYPLFLDSIKNCNE